MNFCEMLSVQHEMLFIQHKWLVEQVKNMREMQRAPSVLVRSGKRKAVERAVDGYIETYKDMGEGERHGLNDNFDALGRGAYSDVYRRSQA